MDSSTDCLNKIVSEMNVSQLIVINERLLLHKRIKEPLKSAYQVKCDAVDCKYHIYSGPWQFCSATEFKPRQLLDYNPK